MTSGQRAGLRHRRPGFKSQPRRCRVTVLGKLFTPIVPLFTKHQKLVADFLRVARVTAGLAESNGSLPAGVWLTSSAGWLPRTGISSGTLRSVIEYGLPLRFLLLAGREYVSICKNCAVCDNFLKLCMVLGMDITFSKTTAHKLGKTPGGRYAKNPRWPSLETEKAVSPLLLALQPCVIPVYLFFWFEKYVSEVIYKF